MRLLRKTDIETALPMRAAIRLMEQAFIAISHPRARQTGRQVLETGAGHALLMGAAWTGQGIAAKLVTVLPGNRKKNLPVTSGLAVLLDENDGQPLALLDATALTAWRTAAAAGFATDLLARKQARVGLLIGCGTQARAQLLAMDVVRDLDEIRVAGRDISRARAFVAAVQEEVATPLIAVEDRHQAARDADIITTATNSSTPVLDGDAVPPGCHVNGIGSFRPEMCELDAVLVARAKIFVDSRSAAATEAGELMAACTSGITTESEWVEIGEALVGDDAGRISEDPVTLYKSVGHAMFDLFAARAVHARSLVLGLGDEWTI